jgi:trimethylamine--corrinoid protein Co-methyltransferase
VDEESLAFEAMRQVVEGGGDFLAHDHTLQHFRTELSDSPLMARTQRESWQAAGASTLAQRAAQRVQQILDETPAPHLSDQQLRDIGSIEKSALRRCQ